MRTGFGLGCDGFWVEAWGFGGCGFGVWGGTGWVRGLVCWVFGLVVLCRDMSGWVWGFGGLGGLFGTWGLINS